VNFNNFTLNLTMTKLNSQTKMTKLISKKMTISNKECSYYKLTESHHNVPFSSLSHFQFFQGIVEFALALLSRFQINLLTLHRVVRED